MSEIYRGFDLKRNPDGTYWVSRDGDSYHVAGYEQALELVDKIKKEERGGRS